MLFVIATFSDGATEDFFHGIKSRRAATFAAIASPLSRRLDQLNAATVLSDMAEPKGNNLHALDGALAGFHAVRVSEKYRLIFRFVDGNVYDVRCGDYHSHGK